MNKKYGETYNNNPCLSVGEKETTAVCAISSTARRWFSRFQSNATNAARVWTRWYVSQSLSDGNTAFEKGLPHVGQRALTAGANALADMSANNTPIKEALKKQVKSEISALNPINRKAGYRRVVISRIRIVKWIL